MNILFFTLLPSAELYMSLADEFKAHGHNITFVAPSEEKTHHDSLRGHNILYFHAGKMMGVGIFRKGFNNILFSNYAFSAVRKYLTPRDYQLILMSTPPLGYYSSIRFLKNANPDIKFYEILRDIHPEGATHLLKRIPGLFGYFRKQALGLYELADAIGCMSPHSVTLVQSRYLKNDIDKVHLLPNWGRPVLYSKPNKEVLKKYGFDNKYILIYGGNMGKPQNLTLFLKLAKDKQDLKDVLFLFIGSGTEREKLRQIVRREDIKNVRIEDAVPQNDYNEIIKCASVGIISLHPQSYFANIPSKVVTYWQNKIPVLASLDAITDFGTFYIDKSNSGLWSLATEYDSLSHNFDTLYNNKELRETMGESGNKYFLEHFTVDKCYSSIMEQLFN